jgi:hypothetical protein
VGFCPGSLRFALAAADLDVVSMDPYNMALPLGDRVGLGARLQQHAVNGVLKLGGLLGQAAGITCWARRPAEPAVTVGAGGRGIDR